LRFFPRDYQDRTKVRTIAQLRYGETVCVRARAVERARTVRVPSGLLLSRVVVSDDENALTVTFFNRKYAAESITPGVAYIFYGKIGGKGGRLEMLNPDFEPEAAQGKRTSAIIPVYRLTAGMGRARLSAAIENALEICKGELTDPIPESVRREYGLMGAPEAYKNIHFPESWEVLSEARRRMVFEELFLFSLGLSLLRERRTGKSGPVIDRTDLGPYLRALPYSLTRAQRHCVDEALADMSSGRLMNRLIQGDVGSGKTAVAAACAFCAVQSGYQCALMAPTEILAKQHFQTLSQIFENCGYRVELLTGGMTAASKRGAQERIASGEARLIIGTHALISKGVEYANLGLVITDEQHRFGVTQRAELASKGAQPHVLVMSATPIPRTMALILYGDLDISVIEGMPPGRIPVKTYSVDDSYRARIYDFMRKLVREGRQVFVVCPAIEDNEEMPMKSVEEYGREMREEIFPDLRVDCIHGRMHPAEKEAVMERFASNGSDILVATTVIEVGMDVPNAALMVVENAERFGLSQLHQLRGRVGRGKNESYCVLISNNPGDDTKARLDIMCRTNDGFKIAEEDLRIRGPGDFFGSRQHGLPEFRIADISYDVRILNDAQRAAQECVKMLSAPGEPESDMLLAGVGAFFSKDAVFN